jgi:hypothetical protein
MGSLGKRKINWLASRKKTINVHTLNSGAQFAKTGGKYLSGLLSTQ